VWGVPTAFSRLNHFFFELKRCGNFEEFRSVFAKGNVIGPHECVSPPKRNDAKGASEENFSLSEKLKGINALSQQKEEEARSNWQKEEARSRELEEASRKQVEEKMALK